MTAEEKRQEKARQMRYKKPIVKDLNYNSIKEYLWEIQEQCSDVQWYCEDKDTLIDALDGDEEEAYEFKMMFSGLEADCERMLDDMNDWMFESLQEFFNLFFVVMGAENDFGGLLGYDSYEEDYFGLEDFSAEWVESDARKKIERLTKKEIVDMAKQCFRIYQSFIALRYRYDCLKASLDILQEKNQGHIQMIKHFEEVYERADKESMGFKYGWKESTELDKLLDVMPQEVWLW